MVLKRFWLVFLMVMLFMYAPIVCAEEQKDPLASLGDAMASVAEKSKQSVVNISTTRYVKQQPHPFFDDPLFRRFFGDSGQQQKRKVTNLGSGVIVSQDGYILTNNHVIDGADDIIIKLFGGREVKGRVVGMDSRTDLAVIKVNESNLPAIKWGDSERLRVGEIVLAIGNPFGLSSTITMGIVSALGRSGIGITDYEDFIQTDAAINPGNSGGALINTKGELVGINTAILSRSGGYQGIGFAIPSNMARTVMDSIINEGKVVRGWLGVQIQQLSGDLAKQFNAPDDKGALVVDIIENSPAEKSGIQRGDIIVEYDNKKVETPSQLKNLVAMTRPNQEVNLVVIREGKPKTIKVQIKELPSDTSKPESQPTVTVDNVLKGVSVQDVTDDVLQKLGITKKIKGVIVNSIDEDSKSLGILQRGDIILELNRKPVTNIKEYQEVVSKIEKNQDVLALIIRNKTSIFITIPAK